MATEYEMPNNAAELKCIIEQATKWLDEVTKGKATPSVPDRDEPPAVRDGELAELRALIDELKREIDRLKADRKTDPKPTPRMSKRS